MTRWHTPEQLAELLSVNIETISTLIRRGDIAAVNVSLSAGSKKPRWRVSQEALDQFLASRANSAPAPRPARRRRMRDEGIIHFV